MTTFCQPVMRKAKMQLLSLFTMMERRLHQCRSVTQPIKYVTYKNHTVLKNSDRCFGLVPTPPESDDISLADHPSDADDDFITNLEQATDGISGKNVKVRHMPVMVEEVLAFLEPKDNQVIVDMTFGAGGHAQQILKVAPDVRYIASDRDPMAFSLAEGFAKNYRKGQVIPLLSTFSELPVHLERIGVRPGSVDGFLMDLGASSMQFDSASRGFALSQDGPLDMRMDGQRFSDSLTAADVVNTLEPHELARILKKYGEERNAKAIAYAIVEARYAFGKFTRTKQLADVIKAVFDSTFRHDKLHRHSHVATKTFQALRIFVNDELNQLHNGLEVAHHYLKTNGDGRCAVISFHSLEDRIVKRHFHGISLDLPSNMSIGSLNHQLRDSHTSYHNEEIQQKYLCHRWHPLSKKITEPSASEVSGNPRSRSAKLRAALKIAQDG